MKKTNKLTSILIVLSMLLSVTSMTVLAADNLTDATTSVTLKDVDVDGLYEIGTAQELYAFANLVNAGNTSIGAELTADITLNENVLKEDGTLNGDGTKFKHWVPIGTSENEYTGFFDGAKHTISGLYYSGDGAYAGLFGAVEGKYNSSTIGVIKRVGLVDSYFHVSTSERWVRTGGLAGFSNYATFENCYVKATFDITSSYSNGPSIYVGGISGMTYSTARNCYTDVNINTVYKTFMASVEDGGILGSVTNGKMLNCFTTYDLLGEYNSGTDITGSVAAVTDERFSSGEITYLLNDLKVEPDSVWKQSLGDDAFPSFNGKYVDYDETKGYYNRSHDHSFEYSASDDTITAVCTAEYCFLADGDGGSITISAPADLYTDGKTAKEITVENTLIDNSAVYTVTYSTADGSAPEKIGTYTARLTLGNKSVTISFTLKTKVTVGGTVTSFGSDTDDITIELFADGTEDAVYSVTEKGNSTEYSLDNVENGTYRMVVSKNNHVTREYEIVIGQEAITQNVKIHLKGDINGDGKLNSIDVARANSHARGVAVLTGYELMCADVNGNGSANSIDVARMNAHVRSIAALW